MTNTSEKPLDQAIQRYIVFLQSEENKSPLTVESYTRSLRLFSDLSGIDTPEEVSKAVVRVYKSALHTYRTAKGQELSVTTKNHHLTILRAFLRYLLAEEEMNVYPPDRITRLKTEQRKVKVLFSDELQRLLDAPDTTTKSGKRDKAILELFFSTGMRLSELRMIDKT